jgi:fucose 4-O-acetylase-like acetyltransferase
MDALRAATMLLIVPLHSAVTLGLNGYPGGWSVATFWSIHLFRLPLFFAMSGFFLVFLISRKGLPTTIRNRTLRIAVPLAIGVLTLIPLVFWIGDLTNIAVIGANGHSGGGSEGFGLRLNYLWFLWYLLILDGIAFLAYLLIPRQLELMSRRLGGVFAYPALGALVLIVPASLLLLSQPSWAGLPLSGSLVPEIAPLAYNGLFFAFGAILSSNRGLISTLRDRCWTWAGIALLVTALAAALFTFHNSSIAGRAYVHYPINITNAAATVACIFAMIGLATRYLNKSRPKLRYWADSAYWIYLAHMPIVVLLVALVIAIPIAATIPAFVFVTAGAITVTIAMYPAFVRYSPIGSMLNGPRRRTRPSPWSRLRRGDPPPSVSPPEAAAEPRA